MHRHPLIRHPLRGLILIVVIICFVFVLQNFSTQDNEATTTEEIHSEDLCDTMTLAQAKEIAKMSEECQSAGVFQFENTEMNFCNNHTHTWQFILTNVTEPLCGAACYVHTKTSKAELQWMCTGALIEEE